MPVRSCLILRVTVTSHYFAFVGESCDLECSLNGNLTGGTCVCRTAEVGDSWRGDACELASCPGTDEACSGNGEIFAGVHVLRKLMLCVLQANATWPRVRVPATTAGLVSTAPSRFALVLHLAVATASATEQRSFATVPPTSLELRVIYLARAAHLNHPRQGVFVSRATVASLATWNAAVMEHVRLISVDAITWKAGMDLAVSSLAALAVTLRLSMTAVP